MNDIRVLALIPIVTAFPIMLLWAKAFDIKYAYVFWPFGVIFIIWFSFAVIVTIYAGIEDE